MGQGTVSHNQRKYAGSVPDELGIDSYASAESE